MTTDDQQREDRITELGKHMEAQEVSLEDQMRMGQTAEVAAKDEAALKEYLVFLERLLNPEDTSVPTINLYTPESILNKDIYDGLDEMAQAKVDQVTPTLCGHLRMLQGLMKSGQGHGAQAEHYVEMIHQYKSELEQEVGDVLIL